MIEILTFIFGSFWRWLGATIMLGVIFEGLGGMFKTIVVKRIKEKKTNKEQEDES